MALKGYYPSASLGFDVLIAIANALAGFALMVFGVVILFHKIAQLEGVLWAGAAAIPAGLAALAGGILALCGCFKESVPSLRAAFWCSLIALVFVVATMGYAFATAGSVGETGRQNWFKQTDEQKKLIEQTYSCCGYSSNAEKTADCVPEQTCNDPLLNDLGGKLQVLAMISAVVAGIQLGALLCGCCVCEKVRAQQEKRMRKQGLTLELEATGGYQRYDKEGSRKKQKREAKAAVAKSKSKYQTKH